MTKDPFTFNGKVCVTVELGDAQGGFAEHWEPLTQQTFLGAVGLYPINLPYK